MKIFGIVGWSGSGKTTLLIDLIPVLIGRGLTVSTCKHAHHAFDVDTPGKDSYRHRAAGATEVLVSSGARWALLHELRTTPEPELDTLVQRMTPVDLLLVEGFKRNPHEKLEVFRPSVGKSMLANKDPKIVAVASDAKIDGLHVPVIDLDDVEAIAAFIMAHCGLGSNKDDGAAFG